MSEYIRGSLNPIGGVDNPESINARASFSLKNNGIDEARFGIKDYVEVATSPNFSQVVSNLRPGVNAEMNRYLEGLNQSMEIKEPIEAKGSINDQAMQNVISNGRTSEIDIRV